MMEHLLKLCEHQVSALVDAEVPHAAPNDEMAIGGCNTDRRWMQPDTARHDAS